jgi:hypothetical protein
VLILHSNFHFLDLFLSNSFCSKCRPCAMKFGGDRRCYRISSDVVSVSVLKWCWVSCWLPWCVARMSSYAVSGRGRECIQTFISLVRATLDHRHMSFVLLYGFFSWFFWIVGSCLCLSSTQQRSLFTGQAVQSLKSRSESESAGVYVLNCVEEHLAIWLQGETSNKDRGSMN